MTLTALTDTCPYCGELIELLVDDGDIDQHYIEDCQGKFDNDFHCELKCGSWSLTCQ